jgi:hypothetical protein
VPARLDHIDRIAITASDQDRVLHVSTDTLGPEGLAVEPCGDGIRWIELAPMGVTVEAQVMRACNQLVANPIRPGSRFVA